MKDLPRIIFVDDDKYTRLAVHQTLSLNDFDVKTFDNAMDALEELRKNTYDVLITDVKMPQMNGIELQKNVKEIDENLPVIIITGYGDVPMAVEALKNGAYDFLEKPINNEVLLASVNRAVEKRKLVLLNKNLKEEFEEAKKLRPSFQGIIGKSSQMQKIFHLIESIAKTDSTILICGETGTGKELIAKAIHNLSQRENEKFMAINIGAVPETILESELFGYEPGAFTGAIKRRIGKFEYAHKGTLFLDEIDSMPINTQLKLLRVLEERKIERLGSNTLIEIDVRLITASSQNLKLLVEDGKFRSDLYFRLYGITITIPPLRERVEDIPLLCQHFLDKYNKIHSRKLETISPEVISWIMNCSWPGNVRELEKFIEQLILLGEEGVMENLRETVLKEKGESLLLRLSNIMEDREKEHIEKILNIYRGSISKTHQALGISRKSLYQKMRKYGLNKIDYKH